MIRFCKKNKLFAFLVIFSILTFFISLILPIFFEKELKEEVLQNILNLLQSIQKEKFITFSFLQKNFCKQSISYFLFWILGLSIVGIPILLFCYFLEVVTVSFQIFFLLFHMKHYSFLFVIIYLLPSFLFLLGYFFLTYYAVHYSIFVIKTFFFHQNYPFSQITKRYIKIGCYLFLYFTFTFLLEVFLLSKVIPIVLSIF